MRRRRLANIRLLLGLLVLVLGVAACGAADSRRLGNADSPAVHIISGSAEYESEASLRGFQRALEDAFEGITVTASWGEDGGDHLDEISALSQADLVIIFARRMELPEEQLRYIREHFAAGKPALGIRTASHAFEGFPELDAEVFGGDYSGHGDDEPVAVTIPESAGQHPILRDVGPWVRPGKLYNNPRLGPNAEPLLYGTGQDSGLHEPLAWTNRYGDSGRAFYTSMGLTGDFEDEHFRRMLVNAVEWLTRDDG